MKGDILEAGIGTISGERGGPLLDLGVDIKRQNLFGQTASEAPVKFVGPAGYFICYSYESPFTELVSALVAHTEGVTSRGLPAPFYWIEIFAINKHLSKPGQVCPNGGEAAGCRGCVEMRDDVSSAGAGLRGLSYSGGAY